MTDPTVPGASPSGQRPAAAGASAGKLKAVRWVGILAIVAGALMIVTGGVVWGVVSSQLRAEEITVSDDAAFLAGSQVAGPFTAYAQAEVINKHALAMTDGKTYAQLDQDDPQRAVVMNGSFLRTSLFTSVVSFGVAAFAIGTGIILGLVGWALTVVADRRRSTLA